MSLISINDDKCKKDGICAAECPMAILSWQKGQYPTPVKDADTLCISCGHCVAACPHGALTHRDMAPEDCPQIDPAMALSPEQTEHFLRARRSIRNFKQDEVDPDTISKILEIASYAPSGHNSQPVEWQVISGRETIRPYTQMVIDWMHSIIKDQPGIAKMMHLDMITQAWDAGMDVVTRNAPHLVLATGAANNPMAPDACKIAATYFDIAAPSFGVGTCWCGYFQAAAALYPPLKEALNLTESNVHAVLMAGYPNITYKRMPKRNAPHVSWIK